MKFPRTASVIINTYNRASYLPNAIRSLATQTYHDLELIVVNGPSTDNTAVVLAEQETLGLAFKITHCPSRNLSESRNIGISAASGDVIFFMDDDAVAHSGWVERIMKSYMQENVGAVGGFTVDHTGISYQCKYTVCDRRGNARFLNTLSPESLLDAGNGFMFPSLLGTNCSFRADVLNAVNGFDDVFAYMLDETDVCVKIFDLGYRILTIPTALVFHKYAPSHSRNTERIPTALLAPARSKVYFTFKHAPEKTIGALSLFEEVNQYRKDIEFANRWYLDHKKITPDHYLELVADLDKGITEGIALGMDRSNFSKRSPFLRDWQPNCGDFKHLRNAVCDEDTTKLRIYFVSQGFPPFDTAGIARWTYECSQGLVALGHEVHVLTRASSKTSHVDFIDGVWVHFLDDQFDDDQIYVSPVPLPDSIVRRATAVHKELARAESIWGVDVVSAPIWDVEGIIAAGYLSKPVVLSLHTTYALTLPFKNHWLEDAEYRSKHVNKVIVAEKWMLDQATRILGNSKEVVLAIDDVYGTNLNADPRVTIVPHGLLISTAVHQKQNASLPHDEINILFVGRMEERKGPDLLLEALCLIKSPIARIKVRFVGKSLENGTSFSVKCLALIDRIRREKKNIDIELIGFVDDAALDTYYQQADIFVAPSRFESFGLILIEAMARGLSIIAGDIGGMREVITNDVDGLLFDLQSIPLLAKKIDSLLTNAELRSTLGKSARLTYGAKFTRDKMAQALEAFFLETIAGVENDPK